MPQRPTMPPPGDAAALTYRSRAAFGIGFIALGALALSRIVAAQATPASKTIGALLAAGMIALGIVRIAQYLRWRRSRA